MRIASAKCTAFCINTGKDTWHITDPGMTLANGEEIPPAGAESTIPYLGGKISPWVGLTPDNLEEDFKATLTRVERLSLKPYQKAQLISTYLVPQFLYAIILSIPPITMIRRLDAAIRDSIKKVYHLPQWASVLLKKRRGIRHS
jgi:hypothetical protein